MWILQLNDMRTARVEQLVVVATAESKEELVAFLEGERAEEAYNDENWRKVFKKDSLLEWFNEPVSISYANVGSPEEAIAEMTKNVWKNWESFMALKIPAKTQAQDESV